MSEALEAAPEAVETPIEESQEINEEESTEVEATAEESSEGSEEEMTEEEQEVLDEVVRKLVLKVDGEEIEEELPFDLPKEHEEYFKKQLQLAKAANKRMQEASELKKMEAQRNQELEEFLDVLKTNPQLILERMGHDPKKMAEEILAKEVELMEMSDEERKIFELQQELEKIQEEKKQADDLRKKQQEEALRDKYAAEFQRDLLDAIDNSDLPDNPEVISRMTGMMRTAIKNGIDLSFKDLVPLVRDEMTTDLKTILGGMTVDQIIEFLGDTKIKEIVTKKAPKVKKKKVAPPTAESIKDAGASKIKEEKKEKIPIKDFFKNL